MKVRSGIEEKADAAPEQSVRCLDPTDSETLKTYSSFIIKWFQESLAKRIKYLYRSIYLMASDKKSESFRLKYDILIEDRLPSQPPAYRVIKPLPIGRGTFGTVKLILGTLKKTSATELVYHPNIRVLKEIRKGNSSERLYVEYSLLRRIREYRTKLLTSLSIHKVAIVMDYCGPIDLSKVLLADKSNRMRKQSILSIEERVRLSIGAIWALRKVHLHGILHCDVKPSNFIPTITQPYFSHCIDFGLSQDCADETARSSGTPLYQAPETFMGVARNVTQDVYSLAHTLSEIWGNEDIADADKMNVDTLQELRRALMVYQFCSIPDFITGLSEEEKNAILAIFNEMIQLDPAMRPDLPTVLAVFEKILINREQWQQAPYQAAVAIRHFLDASHKMSCTPADILELEDVPREMNHLISMAFLEKLKQMITDHRDVLQTQASTACFSFFLGTHYLSHMRTYDDLIHSITLLEKRFSQRYGALVKLYREITKRHKLEPKNAALTQLFDNVSLFCRRFKIALTLDNIEYLNKKLIKYLPIFSEQYVKVKLPSEKIMKRSF